MATKIEDWTVSEVTRQEANYSGKLELISFKVSYQNGPAEQLSAVPFPRGTTDAELVQWCAEGLDDRSGELRAPDQVQPVVHHGARGLHNLMLKACTKP